MPLHIFGHEAPQAPVRIVGTWDDLRSLRGLLAVIVADHATESGGTFFTAEGEGYAVTIQIATAAAMGHDGLSAPTLATGAEGQTTPPAAA